MPPTDPSFFLYFAYGSNLLTRRLRERTPSATRVGTGILPGHELKWHMASEDGSGKCDVVPAADPASRVYGVVYRILTPEKHVLDAAETVGVGYEQKLAPIDTGDGPMEAWLYYAISRDPAAVPYDWYHAIVVSGAREHGLPASYIEALERARSIPDPDPERARRHFDLVKAAARMNPAS